ncbi:MAG: acetyl-CoA carboxylase biotin carboxyl carrier protein [Methylovirgula sp.]
MTDKKSAAEAPARTIDPQLVETLGEIATRLDLSEIEVVQGDLKIRVARQISVAAVPPAAVPAPMPVQAARPAAPTQPSLATHPGTVTSPMVGTAYLRPAPEAARFVEPGAQVKAGDKLLLIEAMKTFNEIVAPRAGTVTDILVEDGQPVEFGQPLVVIE